VIKKFLAVLLLISSLSTSADTLSLHLFRSPKGINWKSPFSMTYSTLKNSLVDFKDKREFGISHVFVEVKCDSTGEHIYRGQTSIANSNERELIFKKKYGMGVMFHTYQGVLEKEDVILRDMAPYETSFRRARAAFKISPSTCQRMLQYAREYEERKYYEMYSGLQADPLKGEGSGCSAFAVSFLRVGGILGNFSHEWKQIIDVPKRFIGGPLTGNKVNILKIISSPFAKWSDREPHIHLEAWDPEQMHRWVYKIFTQVQGGLYNGDYSAEIENQGDAKSVELDVSHLPTPTGSFWLI
jgi:hypothetical protein